MRLLVIGAAALSLSACAATIGGRVENFHTTDTIALASRPGDFVGAVERAGQSLGWRVQGIDRANNQVTVGTTASMLSSVAIGRYGTFSLTATLGSDGRTVAVQAMAGGNYGEGGQERVEGRVREFKAALTRELGQ